MAETQKWKRVGERIAALIRIRGYKSIELFAHECEVDKSVLNRLIRGKREVRLSTFLKILDTLEVSIAEIYPANGSVVREKDPATDGSKTGKTKHPERGGKVYKFTRDEFDRIEVRKSTRDKSPVVLEATGKKTRALSLQTKTFRMDI